MDRLTTRASGFVATAAVHVGIAALLLAGWQVTRPKPQPKPIIAVPIPVPVDRPDVVAPRTSELPVSIDIAQPVWDEAQPDRVVTPPIDRATGGTESDNTAIAQPPLPPPVASGPTRGARLIAATTMQPPYPSASRALGEEGSVELLVSIDERGQVTGVNLLRSSGHARLDAAAIAFALKRWRFDAALDNGKPVAANRRFTIRFNLSAG
jgi:periplasmic protein TonB